MGSNQNGYPNQDDQLETTTQVSGQMADSVADKTTFASPSIDYGQTNPIAAVNLGVAAVSGARMGPGISGGISGAGSSMPPNYESTQFLGGSWPATQPDYQQDAFAAPQSSAVWSDGQALPPQYSPQGDPNYTAMAGGPYQPAKQRSWGMIALVVLAVLSIIGVSFVGYWVLTSRNDGGSGKDSAETTGTLDPDSVDSDDIEDEAPAQSEQAADVKPAPAGAQQLSNFTMPSQNIYCSFSQDEVLCSVLERYWVQDCPGGAATVSASTGGSGLKCGSAARSGGPVLGYGQSARHGNVACVSTENGPDCWNTKSGKGFTVRREDWSSY